MSISDTFRKISSKTSRAVGQPLTFVLAIVTIAVWAVSGPFFHFSDTWQLVINTGTTIVTFLMVFLIQNTQNRDTHSIQLKLDELIFANKKARNHIINLDVMTDAQIQALQKEFDRIAGERKEDKP